MKNNSLQWYLIFFAIYLPFGVWGHSQVSSSITNYSEKITIKSANKAKIHISFQVNKTDTNRIQLLLNLKRNNLSEYALDNDLASLYFKGDSVSILMPLDSSVSRTEVIHLKMVSENFCKSNEGSFNEKEVTLPIISHSSVSINSLVSELIPPQNFTIENSVPKNSFRKFSTLAPKIGLDLDKHDYSINQSQINPGQISQYILTYSVDKSFLYLGGIILLLLILYLFYFLNLFKKS